MDPYLAIPWILGIPAWLLARRRGTPHPLWWGASAFLGGCVIVLLFDLTS